MGEPGVIRVVTMPADVARLAAGIGVELPVISGRQVLFGAVYEDDRWAEFYITANRQAGNVRIVGRGVWEGKPAMVAVAW